jgi:hypothetical protein
MCEPKDIMNLNFKLEGDMGIITYDIIRTSEEFSDQSHTNCRRLFMKLHRKFKDKLSALYHLIYVDRETGQKRSLVTGEHDAENIAKANEILDLDFVALYLKSKHHSEEFVKAHACSVQLLSVKASSTQTPKTAIGRLEDDRQLKKIKTGDDLEDIKTKKNNAQNVFTNNTKGKQTIMSFFGKK